MKEGKKHTIEGSKDAGYEAVVKAPARYRWLLLVIALFCLLQFQVKPLHYSVLKLTKTRNDALISNVLVMGQFNLPIHPTKVQHWFQKYQTIFEYIQASSHWNDTQLETLKGMGLEVYRGLNRKGRECESCLNLARALHQAKTMPAIDGVLYIHDDLFMDVTEFVKPDFDPTSTIIGSSLTYYFPYGYWDPIDYQDKFDDGHKFTFWFRPDGTMVNVKIGNGTRDWRELDLFTTWWGYKKSISTLQALHEDPSSHQFRTPEGNLIIPSPTQADVLYIPKRFADIYIAAANLFQEHNLFLEFGHAMAVQYIQQAFPETKVILQELCTDWSRRRGKIEFIKACQDDQATNYQIFHPFKIKDNDFEIWDQVFDELVYMPWRNFTKGLAAQPVQ